MLNFDEILLELSYRVRKGIVDLTNVEHIELLKEIIRESDTSIHIDIETLQKSSDIFNYLMESTNKKSNSNSANIKSQAEKLKLVGKGGNAWGPKGSDAVTHINRDGRLVKIDEPKKSDKNAADAQKIRAADFKSGAEKAANQKQSKKGKISDRKDLSNFTKNQLKRYVKDRIDTAREEFNNSKNPDKYATDFLAMRSKEINDNYLRPAGTEGSSLAENNGGKYINKIFNKGGNISDDEYKQMHDEILNTELAKTMSKEQANEWAKVAIATARTEARILLSNPKYRAAQQQTKPYPQGVIADNQSREMLKNLFERKIKEDPKNKKHYQKQLKYLNELKESDTGILYELEHGTIGFKHTSNKKTYADPHNNTSVPEKIKAVETALGGTMSPKLKKIFAKTQQKVENAERGLEVSCKNFEKERNKLSPKDEKNQISAATKLLKSYPQKAGKKKNYMSWGKSKPPKKWVVEVAKELGIKLPASDEDMIRIAFANAAGNKPIPDAVLCVRKISETIENIDDTNIEKMSKKFGISEKEMMTLMKTCSSIKDAASKRRNVMGEAHRDLVKGLQNEDANDKNSYPKNPKGNNGKHQEAYIKDYLHRMHFDAYILGERDGVSSQNIGGDNVEPRYYRECLATLSGFKGKTNTSEGKKQLLKHLTKKLRIYPDRDAIAFGDGENSIEIGKETYRTKGKSKGIISGLGKHMQKCLKDKAQTNK